MRRQAAAWRANHTHWIAQRTALQAELERLGDELLTAQAWIDRLQQILTLSHARTTDIQSSLEVCERLIPTLINARKR